MKTLLVNVHGFVLSLKSNQNVQFYCPANSWGRAILLSLLIFQAFFWRTLLFKMIVRNFFFWVSQEILKLSRCIVEKINSKKLTCVLRNSRDGVKLYHKCSESNLVLELEEPIKIHIMSLNSWLLFTLPPNSQAWVLHPGQPYVRMLLSLEARVRHCPWRKPGCCAFYCNPQDQQKLLSWFQRSYLLDLISPLSQRM